MLVRLVLSVVVVGAVLVTEGYAQRVKEERVNDPQEEKEPQLNEQVRKQVDTMVQNEQSNRRRFMDALIAKITLVCKLEESQIKRLRLASKGATERSLGAYRKYMTQVYGGRQRVLANGAVAGIRTSARPLFGLSAVVVEPIWKKAIETTLNDNQRKLWIEEETKHERFRFQIALNSALSMMDVQIMFTDNQRKAIYSWMEKNIPAKFPAESNNLPAVTTASRYVLPRLIDFPEKEIKAILAPSQHSLWKDYLSRYQRMKAQLKGAQARPAVRANRVAPAIQLRK